jgi:glycosyltransferase involved in cell wall biosynthesis
VGSGARVSVLLPVRDGERHLQEALDSVLGQTLEDFELVVVDDGSRDGTPAMLARCRDPRVRVVRQERLGLVAALNRAIEESGAPYLARMDADDVSLPRRLALQIELLERTPEAALVVPAVDVIDADGAERGCILPPPDHDAFMRRLLLRNPITHGAVMLRASALRQVGGYRMGYGANEDYDLWRRLVREWRFAAVPDVLYRHRLLASAVTSTAIEQRQQARERLRDELWREPALRRVAAAESDPVEARALAREALRRGRLPLAARILAGYAWRRRASS